MIARFFATYAMNTGFQFTVEVKRLGQAWNDEKWQVLPTQLRGQGMALVNVMSMFSQMASPVFVYSVRIEYSTYMKTFYSPKLQSVLSEGAPFILIALVCLLASIPGENEMFDRFSHWRMEWLKFDDLGIQDFICLKRLGWIFPTLCTRLKPLESELHV